MSTPSPRRRAAASLLTLGPHRGAHRVAVRAGIAVLVPLLVLVVVGRVEWTPYAAFGAFAALYGRNHGRADRVGMQAVAGFFLVLSVTLGVVVAQIPESRWFIVLLGAVLAAAGSLTSDAYRWHPPGPIFLLFGFAVCGMIPASPGDVPIALGVATASVLWSLVVSSIGALRDPDPWVRPKAPRPQFREALAVPGSRAHLLRYVIALLVAGSIATAVGWEHPYWAMVAAVAVLSGPDRESRLNRSVHRVVGTLFGVGVAAVILSIHPRDVWAVLFIVVLQSLTELFIGRNYALALLFLTPLALLMGQLAHDSPVGPLVRDRLFETVLGAIVAVVVLLLVPDVLRRGAAPTGTRGDH